MNDKDKSISESEDYKAMLARKGIVAPVTSVTPSAPIVSVEKAAKPVQVFREAPLVVEEKIKVPKMPIWPVEPEQLELWKIERNLHDEKVKAFLKEIESPVYIAEVRASARASAQKQIAMAPRAKVSEAAKEPTVKEPKAKKESRQTRLGQTKMIDDLLKAGKTEKEVFDMVSEKIPAYPKEKLPKLIKLRQYHVKS